MTGTKLVVLTEMSNDQRTELFLLREVSSRPRGIDPPIPGREMLCRPHPCSLPYTTHLPQALSKSITEATEELILTTFTILDNMLPPEISPRQTWPNICMKS